MAWIEAHQELGDHPKVYKLAKLLKVDDDNIPIGILMRLWWWALDYAPDGSLARYDADDLARAARWKGSSEDLLAALRGAGWIDDGPDGLQIHDWYEYVGRLMEQREAKREQDRLRQQRHRGKKKAAPADCHADVTRDSRVSHAPTVPNLTEQDQTEPDEHEKAAGFERRAPCPYEEIVELFNTICVSFPKVKEVTNGRRKAIGARWLEVGSLEACREIFKATEASPFMKGDNDRQWQASFDWILKPANWIKIAEGNYGPRENGEHRPQQISQYTAGFKE